MVSPARPAPDAVAAFLAVLRDRHGLPGPDRPATRPRPAQTAADGTPEPALPTTHPDD